MSNIPDLQNVPELSFIDNLTLAQVREQILQDYATKYRELTGEDAVLSDADPVVIERADWWKPLTHGKGLSPTSCRLKLQSRVGRVIPLTVLWCFFAPLSCVYDELRVVQRRLSFVTVWDGGFFCSYLFGRRNSYERTIRKYQSTGHR